MSVPVERKVKILQAEYVEEPDAILIVGECDEGRLRNQIHSSCFTFGTKDKKEEMIKTANLMIGKTLIMVFDEDLNGKMKGRASLKY